MKRTWIYKVRPLLDSDECLLVPLTRGYSASIDVEDRPLVEGHNWYASPSRHGHFYARAYHNGGRIGLHQVVMRVGPGVLVDHADRNPLNCRKSNLRLASPRQNCQNRTRYKNTTSNLKGVMFRSDRGTWKAAITVDGKRITLGTFKTREEAGAAYDDAARKYFGQFAVLNFPERFDEPMREAA